MQVGQVGVALLAVLIALTLTLLLLSLSLRLTVVPILVLVVAVSSGRSKQGRINGMLASSAMGPLSLDRTKHIFRGNIRLLVQKLDGRRVRQRKSTEAWQWWNS
jgi:hypothetical protein